VSVAEPKTVPFDPQGLEAASVRVDRAAAEYVRRIAPITFRLAVSETELRAAFRLRYEAVIDQGWGRPAEFPDGIEREIADDKAVHLVGWSESRPVTNCRLILPRGGSLLPIEKAFDLRVEPCGQVAQIDRVCISRDMGGRSVALMWTLLSAAWLELRSRGFSVVVGLNSVAMTRLYEHIGLGCEVLAPARSWWSEERYPVRFSALDVGPRYFDFLGDFEGAPGDAVSRSSGPRSTQGREG